MFENKIVVVTGGSSGLGMALAKRLAGMGALLAIIARDRKKLEAARDVISPSCTAAGKIEIFPADVSDPAAVERTFSAIAEALAAPDVLINAAGILREGYFETLPLATFRDLMDTNYFGTLNCIRAAIPYFRQSGYLLN